MSASDEQRQSLEPAFWEWLDRLDVRHRRVQTEHESALRNLSRDAPREAAELHRAWQLYCQVIAELDAASAGFESLRSCAS